VIDSADEFLRIRRSDDMNEQHRASHDEASEDVWMEVIQRHPQARSWVIWNKTIPLTIVESLATDPDPHVRWEVANKRKISPGLLRLLSCDDDYTVRQKSPHTAAPK